MSEATDYNPTVQQSEYIAALAVMTQEGRADLIRTIAERHGDATVQAILCQVIGMANSVIANSREWIETECIVRLDMHPYQAEQVNTPTLLGAALGARMAVQVKQGGLCEGCALRLGAMANQCTPTVADVEYCARGEFLCHLEGLDDKGRAKRPCAGAARWQAVRNAGHA